LIFSTDPTKPGDLKESFDIGAFDDKKFVSNFFKTYRCTDDSLGSSFRLIKIFLNIKCTTSLEFEPLLFQRWPTEVPELQPAVKSLFDMLRSLGDRVLCAMAIGLGLVSIKQVYIVNLF